MESTPLAAGVDSELKGRAGGQMAVLEDTVKIQLSEPVYLPELVSFLRERGCLAYLIEDSATIAATVPDPAEHEDAPTIRGLAEQWRFAHPLVGVTITDG
jgi:hypothetical protein